MKRTAKRETKKAKSGAGGVIAACFVGLGFVALGTALGYAVGSEKSELERKVRKLDRRTKVLREMVDDVDLKTRKLQVVAPGGTFPLFDQSGDIEA